MDKISKELGDIAFQIQRMNLELCNLETEKTILSMKNSPEFDLLILESRMHSIESDLERETCRYYSLLQLQQYQGVCEHEFIDDLIDITPDKSTTIKYCAHCLFTSEN
jgi:hypothetical protein